MIMVAIIKEFGSVCKGDRTVRLQTPKILFCASCIVNAKLPTLSPVLNILHQFI